MKKFILFSFLLTGFFFQGNTQNSLMLQINHKLGDAEFAMNQGAKNNMDHDFLVTRLEYYISEMSIIHDGGLETAIEDLWILVDASKATEVSLGDYDINTVEGLKLHVGVDPDHNHLDPSSFDASHPLAPKFPSMHWGWTAGYRFVAFEGYGSENYNQLFQLHALGDVNYFTTEVEYSATAENNLLAINLDADYTRALENIALNSGVIVHGDNFQAKKCLVNFNNFVFTASEISSSTVDFSEVNRFHVFPNPISDGIATIELDLKQKGHQYDVSFTSINGKHLNYIRSVEDGQQIDVSDFSSGMYFINLIKDGQTIMSKRIVVK